LETIHRITENEKNFGETLGQGRGVPNMAGFACEGREGEKERRIRTVTSGRLRREKMLRRDTDFQRCPLIPALSRGWGEAQLAGGIRGRNAGNS